MTFQKVLSLEQQHDDFLSRAEKLYDAVTELRFGENNTFKKQSADMQKLLTEFQRDLPAHMEAEEIIFSFLEKHIPKLESVTRLLKAEHQELKLSLEVLEQLFQELPQERTSSSLDAALQIKEKIIYFLYLLRNHIQVEGESIYRALHEDLHEEERKMLISQLKDVRINKEDQ